VHVLRPGDDFVALARAADDGALGIAGGDGSLGAVAAVALERNAPFVCIPFGTRNHFARDTRLPQDPVQALALLDSGVERRVDAGLAGERVFLNNVSLGLYAELVRRRRRRRHRPGHVALATARAAVKLGRDRGRTAHFRVDGKSVDAHVLLVANNAYELEVFDVGVRERLDEGRLHLYVAPGWRPSTWEERSCERVEVDSAGHQVQAAIDGDLAMLDTPLEFRVEPRALRLLVPPG
jgi:diacylglycerol kinase family enzyme